MYYNKVVFCPIRQVDKYDVFYSQFYIAKNQMFIYVCTYTVLIALLIFGKLQNR